MNREKFETKCNRDVQFKSGKTFSKGDRLEVTPKPTDEGYSDHYAVIHNLDKDIEVVVSMLRLSRYSDDFVQITNEMIESATHDDLCESMTGENVEPDGHDEFGFPSILLALALI